MSFEPLQSAFEDLSKASRNDALWSVHHVAAGARNFETTINVSAHRDSSSLLPISERHTSVTPGAKYVAEEAISVRCLDDLCLDMASRSSAPFLKIDTQGFERDVLDGAEKTLQLVVGVQIELSFTPLYTGGMLFDGAIDRLLKAGFQLRGIEPGYRDPRSQELPPSRRTLLPVDSVSGDANGR